MSKAVLTILLSAIALVGCGQNDPGLAKKMQMTQDQRAQIADRLSPFGVVAVTNEPVNFNGPTSAYIVQEGLMQVAMGDELPGKATYTVCAACHGAQGQGGVGPMLAGQSAEDIVNKLTIYKNNGQIGAQSALMWGQAAMLSEQDIVDLGEYVEKSFK